jgi:hypothetical protein
MPDTESDVCFVVTFVIRKREREQEEEMEKEGKEGNVQLSYAEYLTL